MFHRHKWTKWSRPLESDEKLLVQWRECEKCGITETRQKAKFSGMNIDEINKALDSVTTTPES